MPCPRSPRTGASSSSGRRNGGQQDLVGRRYDATGTPLTGEFPVNAYTTGSQAQTQVASEPDGDFLVVWTGPDADGDGIFGRRFYADGTPIGDEFQVNFYTTSNQGSPALAMDPDGSFVVVWSGAQDGDTNGVSGRRFDASATPMAIDFPLNSATAGGQQRPAVLTTGNGTFVAAWESPSVGLDIFARQFDAAAAPLAMAADGSFLVTWESDGQDGDDVGVFAQRFSREVIFADGFASGRLDEWSASATSGGDLAVSLAAGLDGTPRGLSALVDDTSGRWVQDDTPDDESRYRARFYFDPNAFDPGEALDHRRVRLFVAFEEGPNRRLAAVVLRRLGGEYALAGRARLDDDSQHDTGFFPITDDEHFVEIDWRRATGPDANDGAFEMWIDGTSVYAAASLDNSVSGVDFARLGALSAKDGAAGTLYLDEFESRRSTYIGSRAP